MISDLILLTGATVSATGGTNQTFNPSGTEVSGGVEVVDIGATDYITRPKATFKSRMPTIDKDGAYSKMKTSANFIMPMVDSQGKTQFNLVRVEMEIHPECPSATMLELKKKGAQLLIDTQLDAFWNTGSRA